jgi:hypothetical protein
VVLTTQSDIDSIDGCTTIFGDLTIQMTSGKDGAQYTGPASPTIITLPSSLVSIDLSLYVNLLDIEAPTTSIVAPNLERIGYGGQSGDPLELNILNVMGETWNLTTTSFPALTAIGGGFALTVNPSVSTVTGFPLLATVSEVLLSGGLIINGSFSGIELPALAAVGGEIVIATDDTSFQCPSNIDNSKIINYPYCIFCGYVANYADFQPTPSQLTCGKSGSNPNTAVGPVGTTATAGTASTSSTATAKPSSTGKTSGASTFNCAGNHLYQIKLILKGTSIYATVLLSWALFHFSLI